MIEYPPVGLKAGPISLQFERGDLRYIHWGETEVLRRWYVAVRDPNWRTIPGTQTISEFDCQPDHFLIEYESHHQEGAIDFVWNARIEGRHDGTLQFDMRGRALSTFRRNRIGFCLLHPPALCAGLACRLRDAPGAWRSAHFPKWIAPQNPFQDLSGISYSVSPKTEIVFEFEGDLFETEDQRNWLDASFKTFCTPLHQPFPVEVPAGSAIEQRITMRVASRSDSSSVAFTPKVNLREPAVATVISQISEEHATVIPKLGISAGSARQHGAACVQSALQQIGAHHIRIEWEMRTTPLTQILDELDFWSKQTCSIEFAIHCSSDLLKDLPSAMGAIGQSSPSIVRWILYDDSAWGMSASLAQQARQVIRRQYPDIPIFAGTPANFTELNRDRPPIDYLDGVCFSAHPQEHAFDDASLIETCATFADAIHSAQQFAGGHPLAVTPITLKKRLNPYATTVQNAGPFRISQYLIDAQDQYDPRLHAHFGAVWSLGVIKYLSESGTDSASMFELLGELSIIDCRKSNQSLQMDAPKMTMYPVGQLMAKITRLAGHPVVKTRSSRPLVVDALVVRDATTVHWFVANMTSQEQLVHLDSYRNAISAHQVHTSDGEPSIDRTNNGTINRTTNGAIDGTNNGTISWRAIDEPMARASEIQLSPHSIFHGIQQLGV